LHSPGKNIKLFFVEVEFRDENLDALETDSSFTAGLSPALVSAFRRRMQQIRAAVDERDFYALRSLNFEKLKGKRSHQHSMRLNIQWRLILEFNDSTSPKTVVVIGIEDYH
jgi:proteic killer suppression protein